MTKDYFTDKELRCKCCGRLLFNKQTRQRLNAARIHAGVPFNITSACRCQKHNKEVGGKLTSSHLIDVEKRKESCAVDIWAPDSRTRFKILKGLIIAGFTRIGIDDQFIHTDSDIHKDQEVAWLYPR